MFPGSATLLLFTFSTHTARGDRTKRGGESENLLDGEEPDRQGASNALLARY